SGISFEHVSSRLWLTSVRGLDSCTKSFLIESKAAQAAGFAPLSTGRKLMLFPGTACVNLRADLTELLKTTIRGHEGARSPGTLSLLCASSRSSCLQYKARDDCSTESLPCPTNRITSSTANG